MSDTPSIRAVLQAVRSGELSPEAAELRLREGQIAELGYAALDLQRQARRGRPEVVYAEGKTSEHVIGIARRMAEAGQNVLMTRLRPEQFGALRAAFGHSVRLEESARLAMLISKPVPQKTGLVLVLAAGTSDLPVAEEAAFTAEFLGSPVERAYDVGVAGLHRLLRRADSLIRARVIIAVAGMEGALPGVVGGLVSAPVIAVPTSVGYGANYNGISALLTMLNGCSPGVTVQNIDNGFGAGYLADTINELGEVKPS